MRTSLKVVRLPFSGLILGILILVPAILRAQQFQTAHTYPVGANPLQAAVGDFNGDGYPDLAVTNGGGRSGSSVSVLLANGNGTFQAAVNYTTTTVVFGGIAVADFNHDGKLDLVVLGSGGVSILIGNGDGTFQAAVTYSSNVTFLLAVVAGDFNGDGNPDLVASKSGAMYFLAGNGDGTFRSAVSTYSGGYGGLVAADFNGDGKLDVAGNQGSSLGVTTVSIGHGDGTFQGGVHYSVGPYPQGLAVGDFNGDGKFDLAVAECASSTSCNTGNVAVLFGNSDGTFQKATIFVGAADANPAGIVAADLNGDGKADLAVVNGSGDDVGVLDGNGDGTFRHAVNWSAGLNSHFVVVGDFNHDGVPDMATVNGIGNNVSILLGTKNGNFAAARNFPDHTQPRFVATGDFNEDGFIDLAVTDNDSGSVSILLGQKSGAIGAPVKYTASGTQGVQVAVADLNGDHHLDLVVLGSGSTPVSVLLGSGDGTFKPAVSYAAGSVPESVVIGDFNADGHPDLAVANNGSSVFGSVSLFLDNGDGTFQTPVTISVGNNYLYWMAAGDFDNDGQLDLAVVNGGSPGSVSVLLGNGNGTFRAPSIPTIVGTNPSFVAAADFNKDGKLDLVVTDYLVTSNNVNVTLGNGDGTFQTAATYTAGKQPIVATIGDFNADGLPDIAVANAGTTGGTGSVALLLGTGGGAFKSGAATGAGATPYSLAVADFNGDGKPDLAVANIQGFNITILLDH
jgi:hypothetical protein